MILDDIRNNIRNSLEDDNIYRTDDFIDSTINDGYKLCAVLSLFDERRTSISVTGTRNHNPLPTSGTAECFAPLYVANTHTGSRVNPVKLDSFEFYSTQWEGIVGTTDAMYYTIQSPYHSVMSSIIVCPIQDIGVTQLTIIGAFIPSTLTTGTEPRLTEAFQDILFHYGRFQGLISEPGRAKDALEEYKIFIKRLNELIISIKARFPSGRDYEPNPVEFTYDIVTAYQQEQKEEQRSNEG
uniref:Uncharacterized protein n=1 Tax=viral metagenome TaxID=1070528 RepID=A0A6M3J493_9ZZZZ